MQIKHWQHRTRDGRFDSLKYKFHRAVRFIKNVAMVMAAAAVVFTIGGLTFSTVTSTVEADSVQVADTYPVLDRIADCESGNGTKGSSKHMLNGQVLLKANTNGTIDIGRYQVNLTYWGKKATELGYDLTKEADNKAVAEWIYKNKGTTDWSSSQKCWYH